MLVSSPSLLSESCSKPPFTGASTDRLIIPEDGINFSDTIFLSSCCQSFPFRIFERSVRNYVGRSYVPI